jgi:hypothetical protein
LIISRRGFLTFLLVATGGAAAAALGFRGRLKGVYHQLTDPALDPTPPAPLSAQAVDTLLATTEAFLGYPVEKAHYADFFRWRAETLPGYHTLYERFSVTVNQTARRERGCAFAQCEPAVRRKLLDPAFHVHRAQGRVDKVRVGVLEREWRLFDLHIFRPIAALFATTDAWRLAGYDAWPGTPRGLLRYTQPHPLTAGPGKPRRTIT